jgi:hypothetical protein
MLSSAVYWVISLLVLLPFWATIVAAAPQEPSAEARSYLRMFST